jgi:hypothetical protein
MASSNRFDRATPQSYVSQYVAPPLDYISGMAKDYTHRYNQVEDDTYKLNDLMAKVNAIDEHKPFKQALDNKYQTRINELADKIAKGNDITEAKRDLNRLNREWVNDPLRVELENSYTNRALEQKEKIKLGAKYQDYNNPNIGFKGVTEKGDIQPLRFNGIPEAQDYQKRADEIMKGIAVDGYDSKNEAWDPTSGIIRDKRSGQESITSKKVRDIANENIPTFLSTLEGQDYLRFVKSRNPGIDKEALLTNISDYLYSNGAKQIFNKTKSESGVDFDPTYKGKQDQQSANLTTSSQSEGMNNNPVDHPIVKDMEFDSKGNLKIPNETGFKSTDINGVTSTGVMGATGLTTTKGKDLNKMAEQVRYVQELQNTHPDLKGLSPKATIDAITKANKSVSNESIPLESISNVAAKNIGDAIVRNKAQRNFYLYDSKGKTEDGTLETVLKKLDISEEDFDKALKDGIGGYTQAGPNAGGYYVEVKDDDGKARRVMISPDKEMQTIFRTSQAVNEARKTMTPGIVQPFSETPNYKIAIKPIVRKDGTAEWSYTEIITDDQGNIKQSSPTTLDEIRKAERDHLKASGYLGTNLGVLKDNTTE